MSAKNGTMDKIFLAKLYDRHVDDTFIAFRKLEDAIAQCEQWAKEYGDRYEFYVPKWNWQPYWKFYKEAGEDDCPIVTVEEIEFHDTEKNPSVNYMEGEEKCK